MPQLSTRALVYYAYGMAGCGRAAYIGLTRLRFVRRTTPNDVLSEGLASLPVRRGAFFICCRKWYGTRQKFPSRPGVSDSHKTSCMASFKLARAKFA